MNYVKWVMWQTPNSTHIPTKEKKDKNKNFCLKSVQKFMNEIFNVIDKENERIHVKIGRTKEKKSPGPVL